MLEDLKVIVDNISKKPYIYNSVFKGVLDRLEQTHLFIMGKSYGSLLNQFGDDNYDGSLTGVNLPFEQCYFNMANTYLLVKPEGTARINGFIAYELAPDYNAFVTVVHFQTPMGAYDAPVRFTLNEGRLTVDADENANEREKRVYGFIVNKIALIVKRVLSEIDNRNFQIVEPTSSDNMTFKYREGDRKLIKAKLRPRMIIYISDKKSFKKDHPDLANRIIRKPEYSWEVMGHYRKLNNPESIGKNRQGEYCIKGYTFVSDYIKGEGELRKKVRVLS